MRGMSAASLEGVLTRAESIVAQSAQGPDSVARELFQIARVIDSSNQLIRLLSDPGRLSEIKVTALETLLRGKVSKEALAIASDVVAQRWSEQDHVLDALEAAGMSALLNAADAAGAGDAIEAELFQFSRLITSTPELAAAFDRTRDDRAGRASIVRSLLADKANPVTTALVEQAVTGNTEEKASRRVLSFAEFAADRRRRLMAVVTSAVAMNDQQQQRLARILAAEFGQDVKMNFTVDPDVVGGMRVRVGDVVYDATILSRLSDARSRLTA